MTNDEDMGRMVDTLLAGGKMLSQHCPKCNMPLFKREGKIICPNCNVEYVREEAKGILTSEGLEEGGAPLALSQAVKEKLEELEGRLEDESDPEEISKILEAMKSAMEVLGKLESR